MRAILSSFSQSSSSFVGSYTSARTLFNSLTSVSSTPTSVPSRMVPISACPVSALLTVVDYFPVDYLAAALDPRFKYLEHLPEAHAEATFNHLRRLEEQASAALRAVDPVPDVDDLSDPQLVYQQRRARLLSSVAKVTEMDSYMNHAPIDVKQNPLLWWRNRESSYPFLSKLAKVAPLLSSLFPSPLTRLRPI